jgi:hypothetical protein
VLAKNDFVNQIVTRLDKDVGSKGHWTSVTIKPSLALFQLARGANWRKPTLDEIRMLSSDLGGVLRNRDYETRNTSIEPRDTGEEQQ